jgi:nucleoside-diphosphate-sugar epimerase
MLVCVTGGTGFLGAHSVAGLTRAGHRVRLLVRDTATVSPALTPLGVDPAAVDVRVGDVTDPRAVAAAVRGADSVLHAAAVYSFDSRDRSVMRPVNVRGTEVVLDAARQSGADPIVHVSSVVAMFPARERVLRTDSPVGTPREPYMATKAAAERIAREHQRAGAPVVITYPSALLGPDDPKLGDQNARLRNMLRGLMPIWPSGGFPIGDVRDTAALHVRLLTAPGDGNRHFGPGRYVSTKDYVELLRQVTGRRLPAVFLPARGMIPVGQLTSVLQRIWPWHIPAEYGAIYTCAHAPRTETTSLVQPRPVAETIRDTVRWLRRSGHLSQREHGNPV